MYRKLVYTVVATFTDTPDETCNGRNLAMFPISILLASVLVRPWASWIMMLVNSAIITAIALSIGIEPNTYAISLFFVIAFVSWFASHCMEQALAEAQGRAERLAVVNRIARAASATLQLDDLAERVYQEIAPLFQADAFFIAFYDEESNELEFPLFVDGRGGEKISRLPLGGGFTHFVVTTKRPLAVRDVGEGQPDELLQALTLGSSKIRSWLGAPMLIGDRVIGVISAQAYRPHAWDEKDEQLLFTITDQIALALENVRLLDKRGRRLPSKANGNQIRLTSREVDLLCLFADGYQVEEIADRLCMAKGTVYNTLSGIYDKLGVHGAVPAVLEAVRRGIITL